MHIFHKEKFTQFTSRSSLLLIALGMAFILPAFLYGHSHSGIISMYTLTSNYLGAGLLLAGFLAIDKKLPQACHWLAYLGERSYSIYLWHAVIATWVLPRICPQLDKISPHLGWITSVISCLILGTIMARLVEMPALMLRQKFFPDVSSNKQT
jgi:peptidoglycan/LPS O-acetylase OafA/YrhL